MLPFNKNLKPVARKLRSSTTDAEKSLWSKIHRKQLGGFQFYRQKNIGDFIVDFYCPAAKLVIELDGGQHYSKEGMDKDSKRDEYLRKLGVSVMRFSDRDVLISSESVLERIFEKLKSPLTPL